MQFIVMPLLLLSGSVWLFFLIVTLIGIEQMKLVMRSAAGQKPDKRACHANGQDTRYGTPTTLALSVVLSTFGKMLNGVAASGVEILGGKRS